MKGWKKGTILLLAAGIAVLTGCSSSGSPKDAILDAMTKTSAATSMTYKGTLTIDDITLPPIAGAEAASPVMAALPILLKGAVIQIHGAVQKDPQRAEMTFDVTLGSGDVKITAVVPVIITKEKVWIKVPQIPGVPLPDTIAGKFVEIDAKKLAAEQGTPDISAESDVQKLGQDVLKTLFDSLDEKAYFSEPEAADVKGLPADYKGDRFIRMSVNEQNADAALSAIAEKAMPAIIDLLLKNEAYMKVLPLSKEQLEASKKEVTAETLKKAVRIHTFEVTGGIKDDYLTYEDVQMNVEKTDAGQALKMAIHFNMAMDDLNKEIKFEYDLPKDAVPVESLLPAGS
ncbi:hypothetical protein [Paenibacillus sp. R14(2021)]|uniref:hypothetical protein n=1 Tax=Paenibacillus sp. R14(2021) TaxID=2859228 RepID=UPI001C613A37|nr:hypothetical protein [Paenibacillus sp. R14(2021)]